MWLKLIAKKFEHPMIMSEKYITKLMHLHLNEGEKKS